ncbi:MAG: TetR family transcriptional regulator [Propionibacteriaceae bacterium]|jgi:AcrR family transcriptional regulator|nr:TetR family transcriptional regulator [Propionibacteriaceae bacterium]
MPKIVDHDKRREELLEAVIRVISRNGVEGTTMRVIAEESGWSTGSLAHYFSDRDDIVASALRYSHTTIRKRWTRKLKNKTGLAAVRELMVDNLPLDKTRATETRLEVVFWGQAANQPRLLAVQRNNDGTLFEAMKRYVDQAHEAGELTADTNTELVTQRLLALIDGLSVRHMLSETQITQADMLQIVDEEIERLSHT